MGIEMMEVMKNSCGEMEVEKIKVTEAEVVVRRVNLGFNLNSVPISILLQSLHPIVLSSLSFEIHPIM
jgi:hypothetical protein